jgi:hypothetical protein
MSQQPYYTKFEGKDTHNLLDVFELGSIPLLSIQRVEVLGFCKVIKKLSALLWI